MNIYRERIIHLQQTTSVLQKKSDVLGKLRLLSVLLIAGGVVGYWKSTNETYFLLSAAGTIAFVFFIRKHWKIQQKQAIERELLSINEEELLFATRQREDSHDGAEFNAHNHLYTHDLDIFGKYSLFAFLNRTATQSGRLKLASLLSVKHTNENILNHQRAVKELSPDIEWRQQLFAHARLMKDDAKKYSSLVAWSQTSTPPLSAIQRAMTFLIPVLFFVSILLFAVSSQWLFIRLSTLLFLFNLTLIVIHKKKILTEINAFDEVKESFFHCSLLLNQIEEKKFTEPALCALRDKLIFGGKSAADKIKKLSSITESLSSFQNLVGLLLFSGTGLFHLHIYTSLVRWKAKYAGEMENWFAAIGHFEALNSLANFSFNHPHYCFPLITDQPSLYFLQLGHPLLPDERRVCNDVNFEKHSFIVLTGSNMSGKSTFLRALGVNMVLANCGAPVCASEASLCPADILVSMRVDDSLADSKSYFFAEISRLKSIIDKINGKNSFVILDEILRGTNSDDKRNGTLQLLEKMREKGTQGIIATHDVEVCTISKQYPEFFVNKCFEVEITGNELHFDYRLRDGVCKNKSATFLMRKSGVI
ncbi:MAG: DNA mismatch repair protein [Crocinitomicaceae bacterium]|nr:DNA mismatch repair protein [Crocinitomicaceae bacterium]